MVRDKKIHSTFLIKNKKEGNSMKGGGFKVSEIVLSQYLSFQVNFRSKIFFHYVCFCLLLVTTLNSTLCSILFHEAHTIDCLSIVGPGAMLSRNVAGSSRDEITGVSFQLTNLLTQPLTDSSTRKGFC
jgi:hypothetical protein